MNELQLKYGCNPHQTPSRIFMKDGTALPVTVLNGNPGYINFLDALNAIQLVTELKSAINLPAAASFKHVSPAGAAVGIPLDDSLIKAYNVADMDLSPLATAYVRARGADRMSSYGDFIALSDECDIQTANIISKEVSDGIIAPGYSPEALEILKSKRKGTYNIIKPDPNYKPSSVEQKDVFGITFEQGRNDFVIDDHLFDNIVTENKELTDSALRDLKISLITLKYTQSNSVCFVKDGQVIGCGAGQQSRIHCTRLAGQKADIWYLRQHPDILALPFKPEAGRFMRDTAIDQFLLDDVSDFELKSMEELMEYVPPQLTRDEKKAWISSMTDVSLGSDAFFPVNDNIDRAIQSGVKYISQPGGSLRDDSVIQSCNNYGIVMAFSNIRLFHH